ncbi:Increased rDNA silencing protein [Microsporum audouinii]
MHRVPMTQGAGDGHGSNSNSNSDNGDDGKRAAASASAALQGATLAFASRENQKQSRNNGSPKGMIPTRQPAGQPVNDGARKAAMIAEAAVNNRAINAGANESDIYPVPYGIGVKDRLQFIPHPNDSGGSTAATTPAPQPAESTKAVTSLQNNNQTTYGSTIAGATIITRPKIELENNPQRIAAKLAVDRSAAGSKAKSRSPSRAASATTISSRQTREYQELITHAPQRASSSPTICEDDTDIIASSSRDGSYAPLKSEVTDAELSAARNMPTQQKYGVKAPPPLPNRPVTTRDPSPRKKMDSEHDQGSILPPPQPPPRNKAVSPPPALPPRSTTIPLGREKPPPPAPRQSTISSSAIDGPLTPRGPLPSLPRSHPHPHPHPLPLPNARSSPLQPQHSGVFESPLADAITASTLASRRTPSPSKHNPPPLPPSRRSRSRSFLQVTHSGNKNDHRDRLGRGNGQSRTPSPNWTTAMKRKMRAPARPEQDFAASRGGGGGGGTRSKEHGRRIIRTHPHKHREGDRKRWRDKVTAAERKRYEGVWAANKGLFVGAHEQVNIKDKSVALEETVSSIVVRDIWTRSRLPTPMLEQIWNIVSHHAYGLLSREEFVVGMWLIDQCLKGHKLPVKVSQSVWDSVRSVSVELTGH